MIRLFTGWDQREAEGWHAFAQSVIEKTSEPVEIIPLTINAQRDGTNAFTYSRFMVPSLCGFAGWALFVDGADMICQADLAELWSFRDKNVAVQVVKHDYKTRHPIKYRGTEMEAANDDYPRKNWSSVILWNCAHWDHFYNRDKIATADGKYLHRFSWLKDSQIGELPVEWNWLCDEYGENAEAKLLHFTAGIPGIPAYNRTAHATAWFDSVLRSHERPADRRIAELASAR